ncbi:granzyme B(G,H)-like isoform X1 [Sorex araneus]|uniref:granzyme B(G,H)-like isoform X1 n=1 Tax=Sorex araneus TaxID=42254 RepID=UPI00033144D6|nr:granzyme B(G,H)-like isoform X1 [Sorex araneus]
MLLLLVLLSISGSPRAEAGEIIGGHEAKPHSRPYMVYLKVYDREPYSPRRCGGFLIRKDVVLTAAHCHGSTINVTLGAHNIQHKEDSQQVILMSKAIPHPDYDARIFSNDIMLLKLASKAKMTKNVKTLRLPGRRSRLRRGRVCSVAGWGQVAPRSKFPDRLQEVLLTVWADEECESLFGYYNRTVQICVGDPKGEKATFKGDSGGPLVCDNVAQGIVAYGKNNGSPPQVFTRISSFLPWIKKTLRKI